MEWYFKNNRILWDARVDMHMKSDLYDLEGFKKGKTSLQDIELPIIRDLVPGKKLLHLQCHFGLDTLSLARMGASVTGLDFSGEAIAAAKNLSAELDIPARFVQSNVYDLQDSIPESFDFIFTSYGAIPWLPDLRKWAGQIGQALRPGGQFFMAEFHPAFYLFDFDNLTVSYPYFNTGEPFTEESSGSYAVPDAEGPSYTEFFWCHSLEDVIQPLLEEGLQLQLMKEYPYSPYNVFPNMEKLEDGKFRLKVGVDIPHIFSLLFKKP